ncbi:MAG: hypothetical protein M3N38_05275 [Pseudomonadota bacterium]|nr:hypothetical protein [Pseudomonadota bacterium]
MSKLLDRAYEKARTLSNDRQDEVGEILLSIIEQDTSEVRLTPEQQNEVRRRLASPGPVVPENEMKALFRKLSG